MSARPLTWRKPTDHPCELSEAVLVADGIGGKYSIQPDRVCGFVLWWAQDEFTFTPAATIEAAQALAESDWQSQYAALSSETPPAADGAVERHTLSATDEHK